MLRAARACRENGAGRVYALAAHGLFGEGSQALLDDPAVDRVIVTDTLSSAVRAAAGPPEGRVEVLPVGPLIGEAIRRLSVNGSITDLLGPPG
jgi:ribose-phosphate pyrophosphokinase